MESENFNACVQSEDGCRTELQDVDKITEMPRDGMDLVLYPTAGKSPTVAFILSTPVSV